MFEVKHSVALVAFSGYSPRLTSPYGPVSQGLFGLYLIYPLSCYLCSMHSLSCRVVELVLSGPREAALDAAVSPQPLNDIGQIFWQHALLLCSC